MSNPEIDELLKDLERLQELEEQLRLLKEQQDATSENS